MTQLERQILNAFDRTLRKPEWVDGLFGRWVVRVVFRGEVLEVREGAFNWQGLSRHNPVEGEVYDFCHTAGSLVEAISNCNFPPGQTRHITALSRFVHEMEMEFVEVVGGTVDAKAPPAVATKHPEEFTQVNLSIQEGTDAGGPSPRYPQDG